MTTVGHVLGFSPTTRGVKNKSRGTFCFTVRCCNTLAVPDQILFYGGITLHTVVPHARAVGARAWIRKLIRALIMQHKF